MLSRRQIPLLTCLAVALCANPWTVPRAAAQSPPGVDQCVSIHEVHPSIAAHEAQQNAPAGFRLYPSPEGTADTQMLLREEPLLRGGDMADAKFESSPHINQPVISFRLTPEGTLKFATITSANIGRPLAIVIAGRVVSAPVIREPITKGEGQISGNFTAEDARQLAERIRSGNCG